MACGCASLRSCDVRDEIVDKRWGNLSTESDAQHGIVTQIAHGECLGVDPPPCSRAILEAHNRILNCAVGFFGKAVSLFKLDEWGEKPRESVTVMPCPSFECGEGERISRTSVAVGVGENRQHRGSASVTTTTREQFKRSEAAKQSGAKLSGSACKQAAKQNKGCRTCKQAGRESKAAKQAKPLSLQAAKLRSERDFEETPAIPFRGRWRFSISFRCGERAQRNNAARAKARAA